MFGIQMVVQYSNTRPVFEMAFTNTRPFGNWTTFDLSNTRLVWYSDPHCIQVLVKIVNYLLLLVLWIFDDALQSLDSLQTLLALIIPIFDFGFGVKCMKFFMYGIYLATSYWSILQILNFWSYCTFHQGHSHSIFRN